MKDILVKRTLYKIFRLPLVILSWVCWNVFISIDYGRKSFKRCWKEYQEEVLDEK